MNGSIEIRRCVVLEMTPEEAEFLKHVLDNFKSEGEPQASRNMRVALFDSIPDTRGISPQSPWRMEE